MSKRVDTSGLDAGFIIGQAVKSNREQKPEPVLPPEPQAVPEETAQPEPVPVVVATEPVREPEPPKEESKRKKNKSQEYETLFFKESAIKIVRVIGENEFSLFGYLDNILEHHFSTYQDEITELYRKKNTDVF